MFANLYDLVLLAKLVEVNKGNAKLIINLRAVKEFIALEYNHSTHLL